MCSDDDPHCDIPAMIEPYVRVIFIVLSLHQLFIEFFQMKKDGFVVYISQRSNKIDLLTLFSNISVLILVWADFELYKVRIFASVGVVALWV